MSRSAHKPRKAAKATKPVTPVSSVNMYDVMKKTHPDLLPERRHYEGEEELGLSLPYKICLVGPTGSGKSNTVAQLLLRSDDAYDFYVLVVKKPDEPLFKLLRLHIEQKAAKRGVPVSDMLLICENIEQIPPIDETWKQDDPRNTVLYLDDQMCSLKALGKMDANLEQILIRGRSMNISCVICLQAWSGVDGFLRSQMTHVFFLRCRNERALRWALGSIGDVNVLYPLYKRIVAASPTNWMTCDLTTSDPKWQYRCCLDPNEGGEEVEKGIDSESSEGSDYSESGSGSDDDEPGGGLAWKHENRKRDDKGRWLARKT